MAAPVVPTYLVADLAADVRRDSDLNSSQIYSDDDIATLISDAGSSLRDVFTGANQHYDVSEFAFTLVGGVGQNAVNLPADFQQGHSVDVNPGTSQPYTLRYLSNWLDRNRLNLAPFSVWGPGGGPREYYFLGSNPGQLIVLPAMGAAGNFLLYYTPMWMPLAIPATLLVETASIPVVPATTMGFGGSSGDFILDAGPDTFLVTDVGCILTVLGAVNSDNNGSKPIAAFVSATNIDVTGTTTSETFPGGATVTLLRQSRVAADGTWTLYGDNAFNNASIAVNVGDTLVVSGTQHNDGSYTITQAATGGTTILTAGAVGLTAENFNSADISISVQPAGTRPDLPANMNPWVLYLKTMACITIRNKRGQDVEAFMARLSVDQQRIEKILQERQEEPQQPPLTRNSGFLGGW